MLKRTLTLMAMAMFASYASAAIECFDLPHGENGKGSHNSIIIPPFLSSGIALADIYMTNIGSKPINVNLKFYDENGQQVVPTGVSYYGKFSDFNDPIRKLDGTGIALLSSFHIGRVRIDEEPLLTGILTWQANACLTEPTLSVKIENSWYGNGLAGRAFVTVNGGNPF